MADIKSMSWVIPQSIDLEEILNRNPPGFKYKIDYFYYLIDTITEASELEDLDDTGGFVNLKADRLQKFNKQYKKYLEYLIGRVIRRNYYIPGKKSYGYYLSYRYPDAGLTHIPIKDFIARKNVKKEHAEKIKKSGVKGKKYKYLTKWFNKNLSINGEEAIKKVDELYPNIKYGSIGGKRRGKPSRTTKRYKALVSIAKFEKQEFYYSVDSNIGRFHSNIANIKKELRDFITYKDQKLVNIDIKNSQPLFSQLLLNKEFYKKKFKKINIYEIQSVFKLLDKTNNKINKLISIIDHYIIIVENDKNQSYKGFQEYISLVNSGDFYKGISSLIVPNDPFIKAEMKKMMFLVFFSSNRFIGHSKAKFKKLFKNYFPEVYEVFRLLKKHDHSALSHILQRIESKVIVEKAARRISMEQPTLPIFTVHDSIATTVGNEGYVKVVIEDEIYKLTGLKAMLGIEYWG